MFEVLISKKSKISEEKAKKAGFTRVVFIDQKDFILIATDSLEELRKEISSASSKGKTIAVLGSNDEINRVAVSDKRVSILLSPERTRKRNFMHYRDSGLNQVLCELASKNKVLIGVDFSSVKKLKGLERAERIGKIMQNIDLCRKYKTKMVLASFGKKPSDPYTLRSFGLSLGMSTDQLKESLESASELNVKKV